MAELKPQAGTWTLTAPDGRQWQAESPIRCVVAEQNERIPASAQLANIREALRSHEQPKVEAVEPVAWLGTARVDVGVGISKDPCLRWHKVDEDDEPLYAHPPVSRDAVLVPTFARRWKIARDGFGLERDDETGNYVHIDDALDVLHKAMLSAGTQP